MPLRQPRQGTAWREEYERLVMLDLASNEFKELYQQCKGLSYRESIQKIQDVLFDVAWCPEEIDALNKIQCYLKNKDELRKEKNKQTVRNHRSSSQMALYDLKLSVMERFGWTELQLNEHIKLGAAEIRANWTDPERPVTTDRKLLKAYSARSSRINRKAEKEMLLKLSHMEIPADSVENAFKEMNVEMMDELAGTAPVSSSSAIVTGDETDIALCKTRRKKGMIIDAYQGLVEKGLGNDALDELCDYCVNNDPKKALQAVQEALSHSYRFESDQIEFLHSMAREYQRRYDQKKEKNRLSALSSRQRKKATVAELLETAAELCGLRQEEFMAVVQARIAEKRRLLEVSQYIEEDRNLDGRETISLESGMQRVEEGLYQQTNQVADSLALSTAIHLKDASVEMSIDPIPSLVDCLEDGELALSDGLTSTHLLL